MVTSATTALIPAAPYARGGGLTAPEFSADWYAQASRSPNTRRAYASDWSQWVEWCEETHKPHPLPAQPMWLAEFLRDQAQRCSPETLARRLASIAVAHRMAGITVSPTTDPYVRAVLAGIRRNPTVTGRGPKDPALLADLVAACRTCGDDLAGARDRALLTLGWAGAFRRSELAALDVEDVELCDDGLQITLLRSKTHQVGPAQLKGVMHARDEHHDAACPVCSVVGWIARAQITTGPLFRPLTDRGARLTPTSVGEIIAWRLRQGGFTGAAGGHSLRSGLVTQAALTGVDALTIQGTTGHRRIQQLADYVHRRQALFVRNAAHEAGL